MATIKSMRNLSRHGARVLKGGVTKGKQAIIAANRPKNRAERRAVAAEKRRQKEERQ